MVLTTTMDCTINKALLISNFILIFFLQAMPSLTSYCSFLIGALHAFESNLYGVNSLKSLNLLVLELSLSIRVVKENWQEKLVPMNCHILHFFWMEKLFIIKTHNIQVIVYYCYVPNHSFFLILAHILILTLSSIKNIGFCQIKITLQNGGTDRPRECRKVFEWLA